MVVSDSVDYLKARAGARSDIGRKPNTMSYVFTHVSWAAFECVRTPGKPVSLQRKGARLYCEGMETNEAYGEIGNFQAGILIVTPAQLSFAIRGTPALTSLKARCRVTKGYREVNAEQLATFTTNLQYKSTSPDGTMNFLMAVNCRFCCSDLEIQLYHETSDGIEESVGRIYLST